jgi:mannose-1-phosphate guanylyltransferase
MAGRDTWAVVLAAGEGSRLRGLTRDERGIAIPKQFCSLQGGPALLQEALQRASTVASLSRVCSVVAEQHRAWWMPLLNYLPEENVFVQPHNRGTAHGILLPLLRIAARDADATVVLLPADHYLRDEAIMAEALRHAAVMAHADRGSIYLLGVEPDEPDTELGYILPASPSPEGAAKVLRFIEKPNEIRARVLLDQGALWNVFIMAASIRTLLGLFDSSYAGAIAGMRGIDGETLESVYRRLPTLDFSKHVLQGNESSLKVLSVPHCGWTDLGTPERVGLILERLPDARLSGHAHLPAHVSLARRYTQVFS